MRKLLFKASYNGSRYHGYQVQENAITVAETLQDAIEKAFGKREDIVGCSRTDTGVHAREYFFHLETENDIPCSGAVVALNNLLPSDIAILSCEEVSPDFHARYNVKYKEYVYKIHNSAIKNPFLSGQALCYKYELDEVYLNELAKEFVGTYDYSAFCSAGGKPMDSYVRTIYDAKVTREGELVTFSVTGDGFLYNMVRIMVGTLLLTPIGKLKKGDIKNIILSQNRENAGITAPAEGLYLNRVSYEEYVK